jgi:hypothetical protein
MAGLYCTLYALFIKQLVFQNALLRRFVSATGFYKNPLSQRATTSVSMVVVAL